jgi:Uma2 family endonuclease
MSAERRPQIVFTEREYFEFENDSSVKHEYFQGQLYAMAGATVPHNRITGNTFASLHSQLRGRPCEPFTSDQRLKVEANGLIAYPDVLVACEPLLYGQNDRHTLINATVIIEVLSPSTAHYDREGKFDFYRELPSLRHYVLIAQSQMEVDHRWFNSQTGAWQSETFTLPENRVHLAAIDCVLSVAELYERIEF